MYRRIALPLLFAAILSAAPADDRQQDREEIRAHIDRIFQDFIRKDWADLRATHDENWRGFLTGSTKVIRGLEEYMLANGIQPGDKPPVNSPYGMKSYKMRDFDIAFQGDAAFVSFVSDVEYNFPDGPSHNVLRICDFYAKRNGHWIQAGSDTEVHPEAVAKQNQSPRTLPDGMKKRLLEAREAVWRAWFANDRAALEKLIPAELVTIEPSGDNFGTRQFVLAASEQFVKSGAKLARLEFPKTEIQCYGYTAIVYSTYLYELEKDGKRTPQSGRVTEVFVYRDGQWVNPGWHMDTVK
jgi:ketosteroid isomerase-like protein